MSKNTSNKVVPEERLTFASPDFDHDAYARVALNARLEAVRLTDSKFSVKPAIFMEAEGSGKELKQGFSGSFRGHHFDQEDGFAVGGYRWEASGKFGSKPAFKMAADYMLSYSGLQGVDPEYVRLYFQKIARFTTYPYFRAHFSVHTSAAEMFLAPLPALTERVD